MALKMYNLNGLENVLILILIDVLLYIYTCTTTMQNMLEQGPDLWRWFDTTQFIVPLCSPNTCKDVFNPNITTFQCFSLWTFNSNLGHVNIINSFSTTFSIMHRTVTATGIIIIIKMFMLIL